ncbi:unnamed protein product, partial [Rotaria sp. Silwood1]
MNMKHSLIQLIDLPDEILILIFKTLNNVDLLYSLMGINVKLTQFIRDPIFTNRLTLFRYSSNDLIYPLDNTILDRFCLQILPEIHHKIKWLNVEPLSMERILLITNYSNLHGLGLYNIEDETFRRLFAGKKYDDSSIHQNLEEKLPSLTSFSLTCDTDMSFYWELIVPLIHRMLNLEELTLYIELSSFKIFIDGNNLKENIIYHLSRLNKFVFNILSIMHLYMKPYLPTNEEIEHTFANFTTNKIISSVDYFPRRQ